jgi:hypothetical protein
MSLEMQVEMSANAKFSLNRVSIVRTTKVPKPFAQLIARVFQNFY